MDKGKGRAKRALTFEKDDVEKKPAKRQAQSTMIIMMLGEHAALSRMGQDRSILMQQTFVNPLVQHKLSKEHFPPLAIPFMPWSLVGSDETKLIYRPVSYKIAKNHNALLRMFVFSVFDTGRIQLVEQKFLALFSLLVWGLNKRSTKPFYGAWHRQSLSIGTNIYLMPQNIASFVWKRPESAPYETDVFDPYGLPHPDMKMSTRICMSKMHCGPRTSLTCPLAAFVFMIPMCNSCFVGNCAGVASNMAALLNKKSPWRAVDALNKLKEQHHKHLMPILTKLRRVHLVAALDVEADPSVFYHAERNEEHGTLVEQMHYCFPHVYQSREQAFSVSSRHPMTAFGKNMFNGGQFSAEFKTLIAAYRSEIQLNMREFVNFGRAALSDTLDPVPENPVLLLPLIKMDDAISTGLFPHHQFVVDDDFVAYSQAYVRVMTALASGYLKLKLNLLPPIKPQLLMPKLKQFRTVRRVANVKWNKATGYIQVGNKKGGFFQAEELRYEWIASVLDVHEQASDAKHRPKPKSIFLELNGSYYKAASGVVSLERDLTSCQPSIVTGGCFAELVDIALNPLQTKLLATDALTVQMHPELCDPLQYDAETELHETLSSDEIFGILRAENKTLQSGGVSMSANITAFCEQVGCAPPFDADAPLALPPRLNADLIGKMLKMKQHFKAVDCMGISKPLMARIERGSKEGKLLNAYEVYLKNKN